MKFVVYLLEIYMRFSKVAIFGVIAVVEKRDSKKKGGKKSLEKLLVISIFSQMSMII